MSEKINLDDLYKNKFTHDHKLQIYDKLLERIHKKIKTTVDYVIENAFVFTLYLIILVHYNIVFGQIILLKN